MRDHALGFIDNTINEAHRWIIKQQETNEAVGVVSIHTINSDTGDADTGYWIAPWGRRRGAPWTATPKKKFRAVHVEVPHDDDG